MSRVIVTGAGGFIGGHLVKSLLQDGHDVWAIDKKPIKQWYQRHRRTQAQVIQDLSRDSAQDVIAAIDPAYVYNLAADMGGMGFISANKAACMLNVQITTNVLEGVRQQRIPATVFQASSACVYPSYRQQFSDVVALVEEDAYPADPEDGYGWEKLFGERLCRHYFEDFGVQTRVARIHNCYGPHETWEGGREKAPAAICRKVATALIMGGDEIDIWGDGDQTRSFTYVDDVVTGIKMITKGHYPDPLNLGSSALVTINGLVDLVEEIVGTKLRRVYSPNAPQGVRGRNSDNTLIKDTYNWAPSTSLKDGLGVTYAWILNEVRRKYDGVS